jgi:hypothetical protein
MQVVKHKNKGERKSRLKLQNDINNEKIKMMVNKKSKIFVNVEGGSHSFFATSWSDLGLISAVCTQ